MRIATNRQLCNHASFCLSADKASSKQQKQDCDVAGFEPGFAVDLVSWAVRSIWALEATARNKKYLLALNAKYPVAADTSAPDSIHTCIDTT